MHDVATLRQTSSGKNHPLSARNVIGRASGCTLRVTQSNISSLHAQIVWDGSGWYVQDLNSRNGTFVDGKRVSGGQPVPIEEGATIALGSPALCFQLANASAPRLMATAETGVVVLAEADMLCLPTLEASEVSVFCDGRMRWVAESDAGVHPLEDQELVIAGGHAWRISLPAPASKTREAKAEGQPSIYDLNLTLFVSRDGEHVTAKVTQGSTCVELEYRAHLLLLLELARARLSDADQGHLPASEHGWVYRDHLMKALGLDASHLNIWMYRARQQLAKAKVSGAGSVFERRPGTGQLRIGVDKLCIA